MKHFITILVLLLMGKSWAQDSIAKPTVVKIRDQRTINSIPSPLYIINGHVVDSTLLEKIEPENIKEINILKGDKATSLYGIRGKKGVIIITTKNISDKELEKLNKLNTAEYAQNKGKEFILSGSILDCEKLAISKATVTNLNTQENVFSDSNGKFKIKVRKKDVLLFESESCISQEVLVGKQKDITVSLKAKQKNEVILLKKPILYLYPTQKTEVTLQFHFNGKLKTTFPKYDENWNVIAFPDGKLYDTKTQRTYTSLFWDGEIELPKTHYQYNNGFVVAKENLTSFLIEKLEHIGLNHQETNDFIQFWLPILEQNKFNFIHFLVNEACNEIAVNTVHPKPETSIRVYMEFFGINQFQSVSEQQLPKTKRKGFTLVEWGGTDVSQKIKKNEL
ncbi:hypothetical protein [Flavobacterium sp. J27]|uniref:hypothetical protein n=1 Tax=Flavobacterium sp. J27 TaxID=2060419 RepID=UPI0013EE900A|nr:hypothetical protein [Flavobacterium sp. J27]